MRGNIDFEKSFLEQIEHRYGDEFRELKASLIQSSSRVIGGLGLGLTLCSCGSEVRTWKRIIQWWGIHRAEGLTQGVAGIAEWHIQLRIDDGDAITMPMNITTQVLYGINNLALYNVEPSIFEGIAILQEALAIAREVSDHTLKSKNALNEYQALDTGYISSDPGIQIFHSQAIWPTNACERKLKVHSLTFS
ncbi:hypothetical protein KY289_001359 [Solanum tuberosum]|nr:hypothetical protein KY289_001359 [Solanum tuberosum]